MSGNMQKVFAAYSEMRSQRVEPKLALDKLRDVITRLSPEDRRELARYINALENGQIGSPRDKLPTPKPISRPIKHINTDTAKDKTTALLESSEVFFSYEFFGPNSVLVLQVRGHTEADRSLHYEIRPQDALRSLVLGRAGENKMPDVDFQPHGADVRGVSRQHLSLRYDPQLHNLTVMDLNSSNGSFINGQRLYQNESHILRNGDELRLGKMVIDVNFQHLTPIKAEQPTEPVETVNDDLPEWLR